MYSPSNPSLASTVQCNTGQGREEPLTVQSGMKAICLSLQRPGSGLEVRDRLWLKITIPAAFIGSEVVNWLYARVAGFADRREARKYASQMLKAGFQVDKYPVSLLLKGVNDKGDKAKMKRAAASQRDAVEMDDDDDE